MEKQKGGFKGNWGGIVGDLGWVWGAGRGVVTVRFETAETGPGPVRSYPVDDPSLRRWEPAATGSPESSESPATD